ncbi:MAG: hypothetical protein E7B53_19715 [Clostridium sp.]|uniref:hypothetical protein n=1 Tax=Clostridium sp. TaxID=1506 RepID=UPI0029036541|nr:hypothetical protein [Clostridium sp.]MDU2896984.1 hypothetical protein [Clostridium sp.]MDU3009158.1 hypothetical protein [Clostridium sp.]MDU3039318.1 hypothetical protein [Clostridium sp.]MDU3053343.1 hypothetical protein [Clostridium sp.]
MIELTHLKEINKADKLPKEVQENIEGILSILDEEYGSNRDQYKDNGGYVIVIEDESDFQIIREKAHIDVDNVIVEYVDKIECSNGKAYTSSLFLCNSDYSVSLVIPFEITPKNILNQM